MTTLEKIRAEIEKKMEEKEREATQTQDDMECGISIGYKFALDIIDKYASEECDRDCEHCTWIECPRDDSDTIAYNDDFATALEKISKYEDVKACEDAVSRQAVLDIIDKWYENNRDIDNIEDLIVFATYLPSVQPKAKTGHWNEVMRHPLETANWQCSECYGVVYEEKTDFCPFCGARMVDE